MRLGSVKRRRLTVLVLGAAALGTTTGCELLPGVIGPPSGEPTPEATTAALSVTVERAEGVVDGAPIEAPTLEPSGVRTGNTLQLALVSDELGTSFHIFTPNVESSAENPYGHPTEPSFGAPDGGVGRSEILICTASNCRAPEDFGLEMVQLAEGRSVVLDGSWDNGDWAHLELHYTEIR